jgi:hypothetical protein
MRGKLHKGEDAQVLRTVHGMIYLREGTLAPAAEIFIDTLHAVEAEVGMAEMHPADHAKIQV